MGRYRYTLIQLPMVSLDGEDVPRPRLSCELQFSDEQWPEQVWVRQSGSGQSVLNVLLVEGSSVLPEDPGEA